ncbi:MAG TPA: tetratricopeptide repeat protein, partial [Bacteroidetes bacterium]|nr:tetratricopeptide repeat protein [Bacteroidota bacterium]
MNKLLTILLTAALILGPGLLGDSLTQNSLMAQSGKKRGKKAKAAKKNREKSRVDPKKKERIDKLFIQANTEYLKGKEVEAIRLFQEVLKIAPDNHASMYNIGRISAELEDYKTASKYAKLALDANPENYWYYVELANAYEKQLEVGKALSVQKKLVEKFPQNKNARFDLAQLYISMRDYEKAVAEYDALEEMIGINEDVLFRKHQLYVYLEKPEKALAEIDKLIAFNPRDERYYQAKYDIYMMMGNDDKALLVLADLVKIDPNNGFALLSLADYYKSKGDIKKSDEYLYRAFENPAVDLESKVKILGTLYQYAGNDPVMQARLDRLGNMLFKAYPDSPIVLAIRGDIYQVGGELDS